MRRQTILFLFVIIFCACSRLFFTEDTDDDPESNFHLLWSEFDRYYSHFEIKKVDWDSLYMVYRPQVSTGMTGKALFEIMSSMLNELKDGHVNLYTPEGYYEYTGWYRNYLMNYDDNVIKRNYLNNVYHLTGRGNILYGQVTPELGYVHISTFSGEDDWILDIDGILERFRDLKGIIVDVRCNFGGSTTNSDYVASRFADKKRLHGYFQYRNGLEHDDFTELYGRYIEPSDKWRFTKSVAVLTNRRSYSSTETFVLAMRVFPHVVVVGDTTGGGGGNPIYRELPNGWTYRLPVWIELTPEKTHFESIGLVPDTAVWISNADLIMERDTILSTTIQILESEYSSALEK